MFSNLRKTSVLLVFFLILPFVFAEQTSFPGVYRYKLANGLELFVAENDSAPLAYIEIAVRAGAVTQNPQTAGLFHLYEHMLFKGNEKYGDQIEFTKAANRMGAIGQNGSTGVDRVNYYFTVPSSLVKRGIEFWSYALRTPKLDERELENEKAVVLSEINADFTDPSHIRVAALSKNLFPDGAWRLDPGGSAEVVRSATVADLKDIQHKFYIPANSAVFVGGNVNHEEIFEMVNEIFGDWQNPSAAVPFAAPPSKEPVSRDKKLVMVNPGNSDNMIQIGYYLRGPDGETDEYDTYAADVWSSIVQNPRSTFAKTLVSNEQLSIPESDYVGASYTTRRASGIIGFYATMMFDFLPSAGAAPDTNYGFGSFDIISARPAASTPVDKTDGFLSVLKNQAIPDMARKEALFADIPASLVLRQLADSRIYDLESAKSILGSISYFWSACSSDYFFSYDQNVAQTSEDDVISFVQKYITGKKGILLVSVSPAVWSQYKQVFKGHGYEEITAENAFWQKQQH